MSSKPTSYDGADLIHAFAVLVANYMKSPIACDRMPHKNKMPVSVTRFQFNELSHFRGEIREPNRSLDSLTTRFSGPNIGQIIRSQAFHAMVLERSNRVPNASSVPNSLSSQPPKSLSPKNHQDLMHGSIIHEGNIRKPCYEFAVHFNFSHAARNTLGILDLDLIDRGVIAKTH